MRYFAVINSDASSLKTADLDRLGDRLRARFAQNGHSVELKFLKGEAVPAELKDAIASAEVDALLAGGGDGTVSLAAGMAQGSDKALAVLPGGNMNLFARSLGIPLDLDAAIDALASGKPQKADIAFANDRPFIHEFSLGLHPEMIELRDRQKFGSRLGKLVGGVRSMSQAILRPPKIRVWLDAGQGASRPIATSALAISNNPYGEGHLPYADTVDGGQLGVYIARTMRSSELAAMVAGMSAGRWSDMPQLEIFTAERLRLTRRRSFKASIDGELVTMRSPVEIRIAPGALSVVVPDEAHAVRGQ